MVCASGVQDWWSASGNVEVVGEKCVGKDIKYWSVWIEK